MFQVFGWVGAEGARIRIITTFINTWSQLHVRVWLIFKLCKGFGRKSSKAIKKRWVKSWLDGERNGAVFTAHCSGALEQRTGRDMNTQGWPACLLGGGSAIVVSGAKPSQKVKIIPTYIKTSAALVHIKNNRFCYSHYNFKL